MAGILGSIRGLFGGNGSARRPEPANEPETYKECRIYAEPMAEGSQWRLAGRIVKGEGPDAREHRLVRADLFSSRDETISATLRKARQVIDEQGDALFR
ncbi:HlyU family transcriptional regulator [Hoeflea sp.]|uniref:HlyU family transcriptional regulator n=1 Tax=Hoeflea sp. TaxID=1940281 RepID=UPI003BAE7339